MLITHACLRHLKFGIPIGLPRFAAPNCHRMLVKWAFKLCASGRFLMPGFALAGGSPDGGPKLVN